MLMNLQGVSKFRQHEAKNRGYVSVELGHVSEFLQHEV